MTQRLNFAALMPDVTRKLGELGQLSEKGLGESLFSLVHHRVSQINGCAFCLDLDVKKAKLRGENQLKMFHVAVWRESPLFSEKEKLALEWAERVNRIGPEGITDEFVALAKKHFNEREIAELTFAVALVGVWNRLNVVFKTPPGAMDAMFGLEKAFSS